MMRTLIVLMAGLLTAPAWAQVQLNAYVDKTEVGDSETLAYTLEISGDMDALDPVQAPDARGLVLAHRAPVLQSRVSINGQDQLTLRWLYRPQRLGDATILGARVTLRGRDYRTDPISVKVIPQSQRNGAPALSPTPPRNGPSPPPTASGELFVRAQPSTRRLVPGQQVIVDYVLYTEPHIRPRRSQVVGTWDAEGFWREDLDVPPDATYPRRVTIGGKPYEAVTIRRLALFPTRTGTLDVGAMTFDIESVRTDRSNSPFDPFFSPFSSRLTSDEVTAPALNLTATPLPDDAPPSFGGAVGQFGMAAFVDLDRVAAGEPLHLTVELSGTGNIATLEAPTISVPPTFDRFDPTQEREIDRSSTPLRGVKSFTYTLVPRGGGSFEIPPVEWSYYDPESRSYRTLRSAAFPVTVTGAAAPAAAVPEITAADPSVPMGLMAAATWHRAHAAARIPASALLAGIGLPLLALLGLLGLRRRADRQSDTSPEAVALRAHPEAKRRLREARAALGDAPAFYAALERALHAFLSERLHLPAQGLTRAVLTTALRDRGLSEQTCEEIDALLAASERAQFAPGLAGERDAQEADAERAARLFAAVDAEAHPILA